MSWRRFAAGVLLLAPVLVPFRAGAGAAAGVCIATIRFDFATPISNNAPPTTYVMSGAGTCQTSAGLGKTIQFGATTGEASSARCLTLVMSGDYSVNFFPGGPSGSGGNFDFVGTASGGVALMRGSNPTFIGLAVPVGGGLLGCANGTSSLTFSVPLAFVDP